MTSLYSRQLKGTGMAPSPRPSVPDGYQAFTNRPFLNSDLQTDPSKTVDSFPEGNRDAVMLALKSLQDKIRQLELERAQAESNLRHMNKDTSNFQNGALPSHRSTSSEQMSQRSADIKAQLEAAEYKCNALERQLDYMRNIVQQAESDKREAVELSAKTQRRQLASEESDLRRQLQKLKDLERDHLKLSATQTIAQNKIRDLERQLKDERWARRQIEEEALLAMSEPEVLPARKVSGKKLKKKKTKKPASSPTLDSDHYRLNLGDIPFIAGKSVGPSHALGANFQEVVSLMKNHNTKLCKSPRTHSQNGFKSFKVRTSSSAPTTPDSDLDHVRQQLQDELARLSFSHQELNQQILKCTEPRLRADLERELEVLLRKMEAKGDQIARIRLYQDKVHVPKKQTKASTSSRPQSGRSNSRTAKATLPCNSNGKIEVTTTIRAQKSAGKVPVGAQMTTRGGTRAQASRNLLQDIKKIQATLKEDDISWD